MEVRQFAASGACDAPGYCIEGIVVNGITFVSEEFTGTMDSQGFWDRLAAFAKSKGVYVKLITKSASPSVKG